MACFHPLPGWRTRNGEIRLNKRPPDEPVRPSIPIRCSRCLGCRMDKSKEWALRCALELEEHRTAAFTTLTYDDEHLPPTLSRRALQLWLKRLRKALGPARPIRFFACGEYGETTGRPHYHAILFGANPTEDNQVIESTWGKGHTRTLPVSTAAINYVAGYTASKITDQLEHAHERVDPSSGEVYQWQPPFLQMSRGGRHQKGIGSLARDKYPHSWRAYAVVDGKLQRAPRYLHDGWLKTATDEQKQKLQTDRERHATLNRDKSRNDETRREAMEKIAIRKQEKQKQKRKLH